MRKLTAMLLALCVLLAAVPALGEGPVGNWYMNLADVTLGYILLNEDGTATVNLAGNEEMTGTWEAGEDSVTVTVNESPVVFAYDGTSLTNSDLPIALTQEEGKLPLDLITKMMSGEEYELPEGMSQADLMLIFMNFMTEYNKLTEANSASSEGQAAAAAPAENPEVTVLTESFKVIESYSGYRAIYTAKVQNQTEAPLFLTDGALTVKDASGTQVGEAGYLYPCGSKYLEPGETGFIGMQADLEGSGDFADVTWERTIEAKAKSYMSTDRAVTTSDPVYIKGEGEYDSDKMKVTIINESDEFLPGIEVILALEDAEGNVLCIDTESLYSYELGPNSTINMVATVDSKIRDYYRANGIEPVAVEAFAWAENDD